MTEEIKKYKLYYLQLKYNKIIGIINDIEEHYNVLINNHLIDNQNNFSNVLYDIIKNLNAHYNNSINYYLENSLGFSVDTKNHDNSLDEEIQKNKENLERLNEYITLSQEFMKRLKNASYKISYFQNGYEWVRNDEVIASKIRVTKLG